MSPEYKERSDHPADLLFQWWSEVMAMADSPCRLPEEDQEQLGALALTVTQYLGGPDVLQAIFPELADGKQMTRMLLSLMDKFGINSFSLTSPDLSNIGVAICPTVALINHDCSPNCAVVFPDGPSKDMHVITFKDVGAGEEVGRSAS
jgi:SET and MYND domain-containing protein